MTYKIIHEKYIKKVFKNFKTLFLCLRYLAKLYDYYNEDNISLNELYSFS